MRADRWVRTSWPFDACIRAIGRTSDTWFVGLNEIIICL